MNELGMGGDLGMEVGDCDGTFPMMCCYNVNTMGMKGNQWCIVDSGTRFNGGSSRGMIQMDYMEHIMRVAQD